MGLVEEVDRFAMADFLGRVQVVRARMGSVRRWCGRWWYGDRVGFWLEGVRAVWRRWGMPLVRALGIGVHLWGRVGGWWAKCGFVSMGGSRVGYGVLGGEVYGGRCLQGLIRARKEGSGG